MKSTHHVKYIYMFILLLSLLMPCSYARAQEIDDEVKSLGEILNPSIDGYTSSLAAKERGTFYFKKCMATESLAFDAEEKEILCACTGSKLGEILTGDEFVHLYKDTKIGTEARMKMITFAYTECIDFAMRKKIYKDCRVLPILKTVRYGKKHVCECTADMFEKHLNSGMARLIMEGVKYQPMTLNPLEHYFTTDAYYTMVSRYGKNCHSQMIYNKHN